MDQIKPLEDKLAGVFKNLPQLPEQTKKSLVKFFEWISIIFGVLQVIAVVSLWSVGHRVNEISSLVNEYSRFYNGQTTVPGLSVFYYIALAFLAVSAVTLLLAYPGLKARKKVGWNWLFVGTLVNLLYGVSSVFINSYYGGGGGRLFSSILGSAISFYLLFQVRDQYATHRAAKPAASTTDKK